MNKIGLSDSALLSTKLKMPAPRGGYIIRTELFSMLSRCSLMQIIYIKGAAGMGKTTLVSSYIKETGLENTAWLTLDGANNNIFSFWHYFAAAAGGFLGSESGDILSLLRSNFETSKINNLLTMIINRLCGDDDYYIVLDDMQSISDKTLLDSIEFFIKSMPDNLHLFMLSREDPALYLGEMAVSGRLLFIDGEKLRFSHEDGMRFLKETLKYAADDEALSQMNDFAEGWIGGLQLVAAAGGTKNGLLHAAGSGIAADYLTREIFKMLTEDERHFLTVTGILSYFDEEICTYMFGKIDFHGMIERLTAKNLFIISVDVENGIYRYHNILGEYLKQQFARLPEQDKTNYRRSAAKALEAKGDKEEALCHLFEIEDYKDAIRLLKTMDETVETWVYIDKLPQSCLLDNSDLLIQCLTYNFGTMNMARSCELYNAVESCEKFNDIAGGLRYVFAFIAHPNDTYISPSPITLETIEKYHLSPVTQALLLFENAYILLEQNKYEEAMIYAKRAFESGGKYNVFVRFYSASTMAQIFEETGRLNESLESYRQMSGFIKSSSVMDALGYNYYVGIIGLYHKRMEKENARKTIETVKDIVQRGSMSPIVIAVGYDYHLAEYEMLFGDAKKSAEILSEICGTFSNNIRQLDRLLYGLCAQNLLPEGIGRRFIEEVECVGLKNASLSSQLLYARMMWQRGKKEQAEEIVENNLSFTRANKNRLRLIEADLLKIQMLLSSGKNVSRVAGNLFREAVYYAWENRILQPFYIEKDVMCPFVERSLKSESEKYNPGERQFISDILSLYSGKSRVNTKDILSARELEVLGELAKGLTNPEIASKLCISLATVKTHIINIYGKLGVSSRLSAVEEAKKCGII